MSGTNQYLAQQAAVVANPLTFTTTAGAASVAAFVTINNANLDLLIQLISYEEVDANIARFWMDEMSPAARVTLYKILTDLKAKSIA